MCVCVREIVKEVRSTNTQLKYELKKVVQNDILVIKQVSTNMKKREQSFISKIKKKKHISHARYVGSLYNIHSKGIVDHLVR